jgi:Lon protease-like protein
VSCERLATGRYDLVLRGEARVRLVHERPSDTLYRVVLCDRLEDVAPAADVTPTLARIRAACARLLKALDRPVDLLDTALAEGQPPGVIADRVAAAVLPDAAVRQALLDELDVAARVARLGTALDALVDELKGGRE